MLTAAYALLKQAYFGIHLTRSLHKIMAVLVVMSHSFFLFLLFDGSSSARDSYSLACWSCTFCSSTSSYPQTPPRGWDAPLKTHWYHLHLPWQFIPMEAVGHAAFHCYVKETASAFVFVRALLYPSSEVCTSCTVSYLSWFNPCIPRPSWFLSRTGGDKAQDIKTAMKIRGIFGSVSGE